MGKPLTHEDLAKLAKIIAELKNIVQVQDQLKSLSEGVDKTFVKAVSDLLEKEKKNLYEKYNLLIESLK